jgi:hypothetical protein
MTEDQIIKAVVPKLSEPTVATVPAEALEEKKKQATELKKTFQPSAPEGKTLKITFASGVPDSNTSDINARPSEAGRDGTVAVDLDPLSLLCRLVALVPAPRFHTARYFGVLAAAAKWRPLVVPKPQPSEAMEDGTAPDAASPCSATPCSASGRTIALGPSCCGGPSRSTSRPTPAAAAGCAYSPSSPTWLGLPASFINDP